MGRIVEGRWKCPYCKTEDILGRYQICPNCGRQRDKDFKATLPKNIKDNYVPDEKAKKLNKNPDWMCSYCQSYNSDNYDTCTCCGASRAESDGNYFDIQKKKTINNDSKTSTTTSTDDEAFNTEADTQKNTFQNLKSTFLSFASSSVFRYIIFGLIIALFTTGFFVLTKPKEVTMSVTEVSWNRTIDVEKYQTVEESDWSLPSSARLLYTAQEIHHYDTILDHYETKSREVSKERITGYNTYYTYNDLGNGYFEEEEHSEPIYETYYETEYYEEPVYREEPVYQTKYYYEIDKWLYERSVKTSGKDKTPYWGNLNLDSDERESSKSQQYQITGIVNNKKKTYLISLDDWKKIDVGKDFKLKVFLDTAELIE